MDLLLESILRDNKLTPGLMSHERMRTLASRGYWHPRFEKYPSAVKRKEEFIEMVNDLVGDPSAGLIFVTVYSGPS